MEPSPLLRSDNDFTFIPLTIAIKQSSPPQWQNTPHSELHNNKHFFSRSGQLQVGWHMLSCSGQLCFKLWVSWALAWAQVCPIFFIVGSRGSSHPGLALLLQITGTQEHESTIQGYLALISQRPKHVTWTSPQIGKQTSFQRRVGGSQVFAEQ